MEAKNLEELELQAPFIERTLRPLAQRLSGRRVAGDQSTSATAPRSGSRSPATRARSAPRTGWPIKAIGAIVGGILFFLLFVVIGLLGFPFAIARADR